MRRFWVFVLALLWAFPAMAQQEGRRVALVVGIGSYERLPAALARDTARADAAGVAAALEKAGYDRVRLLTDASATTQNVRAVLEDQIAKEVGPQDLFLLYFVGHGMGADFGEPRLLAYDTDPDDVESTSFAVADLAKQIRERVPAGRYVIATDAAFDGQLSGLALLGPTGNDWPSLGPRTFVVSSAAPRQTARPGAFARAFIDGIGGRADTNGDGVVTASELNAFLVVAVPELTGGKQLPTVQGTYEPTLEITKRVAPVSVVSITADPSLMAPPVPVAHIDKAKFVFEGGSAAKVQCSATPVTSCDPTCYLWDVPAGACRVEMYVEGRELTGSVDLLRRGAYGCRVVEGALACTPPSAP